MKDLNNNFMPSEENFGDYLKECDCEVIQRNWSLDKSHTGDYFWDRLSKSLKVVQDNLMAFTSRDDVIWLPKMEDLVNSLKESLIQIYVNPGEGRKWDVRYYNRYGEVKMVTEPTLELGLIKALKDNLDKRNFVTVKLEVAGNPDDEMLPVYSGLKDGNGKRDVVVIAECMVINDDWWKKKKESK